MTYSNLRLNVGGVDEPFTNVQDKVVKIGYDSEIYLKDILYKVDRIHIKIASYNDTILFNVYKNGNTISGSPINGQFTMDHGIYTNETFLTQIKKFCTQINNLFGKSTIDCIDGLFNCIDDDLFVDIEFKSQIIASQFGFSKMANTNVNLHGKPISNKSVNDSMLLVVHFDSIGLNSIDPFEHRSINIIDSFIHNELTIFNIGEWHYYKNTVPFFTSINNAKSEFDLSLQEFSCRLTTHDLHPVFMLPGSVISIGIKYNKSIKQIATHKINMA